MQPPIMFSSSLYKTAQLKKFSHSCGKLFTLYTTFHCISTQKVYIETKQFADIYCWFAEFLLVHRHTAGSWLD